MRKGDLDQSPRQPQSAGALADEVRRSALSAFAHGYRDLLVVCLQYRGIFVAGIFCCSARCRSSCSIPWLGQDFFPHVDAGQFKLHVRAHTGTRIEDTARSAIGWIRRFARPIPQGRDWAPSSTTSALPYSGINLSYSNSATIGSGMRTFGVAGEEASSHGGVHWRELRHGAGATTFPASTFYFLPTDIVSQILNFGLPAPLDIQIVGTDIEATMTLPKP